MYKILIVEDDIIIAGTLKEHFEKWGYEASYVEDFERVMEKFFAFLPDFVLLDINLPFFNGFHWCSEIRKISKVPILFVSSANDNMSIVMAMNMGGDDYIEKPFDLMVLTAKVQAIIRRTYAFSGAVSIIQQGELLLNLSDASVHYHEETLELTKNEFKILEILMENSGHFVSRDDIIKRLWDSDNFIDDNTLSVNVARLRKKLEQLGISDGIRTKKGIGYLLEV